MRIAWEEPFGPVIPVLRIKTAEEGIKHCNTSHFALQVPRLLFKWNTIILFGIEYIEMK